MYTVVMERGKLEPLVFVDQTKRRAIQRTNSLSWLHGDCEVSWPNEATAIVHTGDWYDN